MPPTVPRARRRLGHLSVRRMMVLVLVLGGSLGWYAYRVRIQRDAVAAIRRAGGAVRYDWEWDSTGNVPTGAEPRLPAWFLDAYGPDGFETVVAVFADPLYPDVPRQIGRLPHLKNLGLGTGPLPLTGADLGHLRRLHDLRSLDLTGAGLDAGASLEDLRGLQSLRRLTIGFRIPLKNADLAPLAGLKGLECLSLTARITDAGLMHLRGMSGLKLLHLPDCKIKGLEGLRPLRQLVFLGLGGTLVDDAGLAPLSGHPGLKVLDLQVTPITDAGLVHLATIPGLEKLYLRGTAVTDVGMLHLAGMPHLSELDIHETAITDAGLAALRGLPLRTVDVSNTRVTDAGLAVLAKMTRLEFLNLWQTAVTDAGLRQLAGSKGGLSINARRTGVTPAGVAALKTLAPGLVVKIDP